MALSKLKVTYIISAISLMIVVVYLSNTLRFDVKWHFDGIFILKSTDGKYVVKDDLYVGDTEQIVYSKDFDDPKSRVDNKFHPNKPGKSYIYYEWDEKDGSGIFRNFRSDGTVLFTSMGRLYSENNERIHGLLVGGALPANILPDTNIAMNESGMAYYNGKRWFHIWCTVNEAMFAIDGRDMKLPDQWTFLGSKVIHQSNTTPVISSYHQITISGVPVRMERTAYFFADEPYFVLTIRLTNIGTRPVGIYYTYGDEPWVGDYGSARGNIGWVRDDLIQYESLISPAKYSYAGMYQYGNDAINEGHNFTKMANFLEWFGPNLPFRVSFTNSDGVIADPTGKTRVPLKSNVRFIDVDWAIPNLQPQQSYDIKLAVGMAGYDPKTDRPFKPSTRKAFQ